MINMFMASFSNLVTSLTGAGFFYERSPRHSSYHFNQESQSLYRNQPRFPFEYYVTINLNNVGTASNYISQFYNNPTWQQVAPLIKSIEMPSMKIDTESLNQYNRKRISQTRINYDPIKLVFHDVADGKTLKFWEMYYRYYFADGSEPGKNVNKATPNSGQPQYSVEQFVQNIIPKINPDIIGLPSSIKDIFRPKGQQNLLAMGSSGDKQTTQNIISDSLDNHHFGFNLPTVMNVRNLIQSIDIFQVHGGRFNKVTIVNPRISAFTHDVLTYADSEKTLEITFSLEYEYAYYTIQNMKLGGNEQNNNSSKEFFEHGETLELPALAFNTTLLDFIESNNPLLQSDNPILQRIGKRVQSELGTVTGSFLSDKVVRKISAGALDGLANIRPTPYHPTSTATISSRSFKSSAISTSNAYKDVNRRGGNGG